MVASDPARNSDAPAGRTGHGDQRGGDWNDNLLVAAAEDGHRADGVADDPDGGVTDLEWAWSRTTETLTPMTAPCLPPTRRLRR